MNDYTSVTELPGSGATPEQLSMVLTRYDMAAQLGKGKSILEVACGPGPGFGIMGENASRVVGLDIDKTMIQLANAHYGKKYEFVTGDAHHLPFSDSSFDIVLLFEAIYYLTNVDEFLVEAKRVLTANGRILICSANCTRDSFNPSPFTVKYYNITELHNLLSEHNFQVKLLGGFEDQPHGITEAVMSLVRKVAVKFKLIPKSMFAKGLIKKIVFRKLTKLPPEISYNDGVVYPLKALNKNDDASMFKVIYAQGVLN